MNLHLELIDRAQKNRWCVKQHCTTCGAGDFRKALQQILETNESIYYRDLEDIDLAELEKRME